MTTRAPKSSSFRRKIGFVAFCFIAILLHLGALIALEELWDFFPKPPRPVQKETEYVLLEDPKKETQEDEEDLEEPPDVSGQIVETPPTEDQEKPEEAEYLAEQNRTVPEEMRTLDFKVNPEVLADVVSEESKFEQKEAFDLNVDKPSTGATIGNDRFDPDRDGNMAALPSKWQFTNQKGLQDPVPASHAAQTIAGAPQNDLLREEIGDRVSINTIEYIYASYINRIKRLVNYYWKQNVNNLPSSALITRTQYTTKVNVILTANGALEHVEVTKASGSDELDQAVVRAFRLAGPFPNPPDGLIAKDGRVYLPDMDFTVQFRMGRSRYQGIDPRAGVKFPGILKSPR